MRQDERYWLRTLAWFMDKMDGNTLDRHLVVRKRVHLLFVLAPVVPITPVSHQLFQVRGIGAVLPVFIGEIIGPAYTRQAFAEVSERGFGDGNGKRSFLH